MIRYVVCLLAYHNNNNAASDIVTSSVLNKHGKHIFHVSKLRQKRRYSNRLFNKSVTDYRNRINISTLENRKKDQDIRKCP